MGSQSIKRGSRSSSLLSARPHAGPTGVPSVSSRCSSLVGSDPPMRPSWRERVGHGSGFFLRRKPPLERSLVTPHTPGDTGEFVGQRDGSDVEAFASFDVECPGAQVIGFVGELAGS